MILRYYTYKKFGVQSMNVNLLINYNYMLNIMEMNNALINS